MQHKSTTHQEMYIHVREPIFRWSGGTIFARLEQDGWYYSAALCLASDQFSRRIGRTIAHRKYFQTKPERFALNIASFEKPNYEICKAAYHDTVCLK